MQNVNRYIEKMEQWPFYIGINVGLAVGIFLCAILGRSVGIQGPALAISVVWPATGLSLAALLLFGYRAALGIFIGNFAYNHFFLADYPFSWQITSLHINLMAIFISLGSFAQALVSVYLMRSYSTPLFFRTVRDVFIFLVPASLLSCLIGSTMGITTLALGGGVDRALVLPTWLTFWLGDTFGIYLVTPLIIVWLLPLKETKLSDHLPSAASMLVLFILFSIMTFFFDYPLPHLFVPLSIWAAYLFRMRGASIAIFLMTTASIIFAASHGYEGTSLISLITFIGVTIAASLIIASVVNQRADAWALLDSRNLYLEKEVDVKVEILQQVRSDRSPYKTLAATRRLANQIDIPLNDLNILIKKAEEDLKEAQNLLKEPDLNAINKKLIAEKLYQSQLSLSQTVNSRNLIIELLKPLVETQNSA